MESKFMSFCILTICMLLWKFSESKPNGSDTSVVDPKLDTLTPAILLKPYMYLNRMFVAPVFSRPDYVCTLTVKEKDDLCKSIFNQKQILDKYKVRYGENLPKSDLDFKCQLQEFNCWVNNIFHLGLTQRMLLCPVVSSETGEKVTKYHLSTTYTPDRVIIFESEDDERVVASVGIYDLKLNELHHEDRNNAAIHNQDGITAKRS